MKKILLFTLITFTLAGVCGCIKTTNATDNSTTPSDETMTTTEAVMPGTITIDESIIEYIEKADATQIFIFIVECDKEWDDVYTDFVLTNEMESCRAKKIYITKKQIGNLKPADGYDIFLKHFNSSSTFPVTKENVTKLDESELYEVKVSFKGSSVEEYSSEVNAFLEEHGIVANAECVETLGYFWIKIYPEDIEKLLNDSRVNSVNRYTFGIVVDY